MKRSLEILYLVLIASFLVVLGSDQPEQVFLRIIFGGVLFVLIIGTYRGPFFKEAFRSSAVWFFAAVFIFEMIRAAVGAFYLWGARVESPESREFYLRFLQAPVRWAFYFSFFAAAFTFLNQKVKANRLAETLVWVSGFIALNAIPSLFQHREHAAYLLKDGSTVFFAPFFYFHKGVGQYLLGTFAHPNYTGDVIALGFFPALGLGIYALFQYTEAKRNSSNTAPVKFPETFSYILPRFAAALAIAIAIFLFFSRGTMLTFLLMTAVYLGVLLAKYPSRVALLSVAGAVIFLLLALVWGGNLKGAWKEIRTLEKEQQALEETPGTQSALSNKSINYVREGARRSLAIYRDHRLWGAGSRGYREVSKQYADPELGKVDELINLQSLAHYHQLLAEEGAGAYLYFLFLLAYFFELGRGLLRTRSRFKFVMGLSFAAPVVMILAHAAFNQLMEQFSMAMPVHLMMGAGLAVLQQDFKHESSN